MQTHATQFWVIGADYADFEFTRVVEGTLEVSGPYADKAEALQVWWAQSQGKRHKATTRFTIASSSQGAAVVPLS